MKSFLFISRRVLASWRFWINYAVILLLTLWLPMLKHTITMTDAEGNIIQQTVQSSRLYQSWWTVLRWEEGARTHLNAVLLHLGLCFVIAFTVWYISTRTRAAAIAEETDALAEDSTTLGDAETSAPSAETATIGDAETRP